MTHSTVFDAEERAVLAAVADVFVPAVAPPAAQAHDPHGFWALRASDTSAPATLAMLLVTVLSDDEVADLRRLLRVLRRVGVGRLPQRAAQSVLRALARADADAREGIDGLRQLTMLAFYGGTEPDGTSPVAAQIGFPGPPDAPPAQDATPPLELFEPDGDVVEADVVVVGSGSGGGVAAATLAAAGLDVVVLEAGGAEHAPGLPADEVAAYRRLYWRSGLATTDEGNVALLAGATLGGGSTVNWSNCVTPPAHVRREWADAGIDGADGDELDGHLRAVAERMGVNDSTPLNPENERLRDGAKALGWSWSTARRNVDPDREDPRATGLTGFGDRAEAKQGSLLTWLPDAVADGARVVVGCAVERVLVEAGRAAGVVATLGRGGAQRRLEVRARHVVVACGALETPALLLRSGIGGPAVGRHLRLHPVPILAGVHREPLRSWWGPPQGIVVEERTTLEQDHGYLLETAHWSPGLVAAGTRWADARDHKLLMGRLADVSVFLAVVRERGGGRVRVDERGDAVVEYPLDDALDRRLLRQAVRDLVELHVASGADAIADPAPGRDVWRRGDDAEAFAERVARKPLGAAGRTLFSAHQMGSARIGTDPTTSVADGDGQLHDTPGVWLADTSAFPTAVGANPMLTTMALARRTSGRVAAAASSTP